MKKSFFVLLSFMLVLCCAAMLWAAQGTIVLKDGSTVEGDVVKMGGSYSIKLADGSRRLIPEKDIVTLNGQPVGAGATAGGSSGGSSSAGGTSSGGTTSSSGSTQEFSRAKSAADRVDDPNIAITLWQKFIADNANSADLATAQAELKKWQDMATTGAERIKGKWVTGDELKNLHEEVDKLLEQAHEQIKTNQTLKAIDSLQKVVEKYPNSFTANFELGFFYVSQESTASYDKAIQSLEKAVKLRPASAAALSNLSIAYNFRRRYDDSINAARKAAELRDSRPIAVNLVMAIAEAPPVIGNSAKNQKARDVASLLAAKYGINGPSGWQYVRPENEDKDGGGEEALGKDRQGIIGSGTGFFVSNDGLILTNRHVAGDGDFLIVKMSDGSQCLAETVLIDKKQDIAVLRIKTKSPTPGLKLAAYDVPHSGADVTVMGYPLGAMFGKSVKITRGVVTAVESAEKACDVIVDAQVNPGNSGGPMLDKYGNVLALVAMKTMADESISSYGMGISPGRLRKFIEENKEKLGASITTADATSDKSTVFNTEDLAAQCTKSVVMIMIGKGELPKDLKEALGIKETPLPK